MQTESDATYWTAIEQRDKSLDGHFVFAVLSTGVFCRPGCPSRTPKRSNVRFFSDPGAAKQAGFRACLRCRPEERPADDMQTVCEHIARHLDAPLRLSELSEISGLSPFHLQRKFKAALGITPRQYAEQLRLQRLKQSMRQGSSVTDAIYEAGFSSSSRVYERTAAHLGMTPRRYRNKGAAQQIRYSIQPTPLGQLLVAATDLGICSIQLGDSAEALLAHLRNEFSAATLEENRELLAPHMEPLLEWLAGKRLTLGLPLDIRATTFQRLVWEYLKQIPYGSTRSYSEIAAHLGAPSATRAVARACATNPVALVIPCHRVVKQDGKLAGYRWGLDRKKALLRLESENPAANLNPAASVQTDFPA